MYKFLPTGGKCFQLILLGPTMVKEMQITKVSIRDRLIADLKVIMENPRDYDFSPRAEIDNTTLLIKNNEDDNSTTSFELDSEMMQIVERDRMVELRV